MAYIIGVVSQKGGVGKSTIARLLATEFARMDDSSWDVKIADMDVSQGTSFQWMQQRVKAGIKPEVRVESFQRLEKATADAESFEVMVLDGAPHATDQTTQIAKASDLVILPTGTARDDLVPTVKIAHELRKAGIPVERMMFVITRTSDSVLETAEARAYIIEAGYRVADDSLPERTAFRRASDLGYSAAETTYKKMNERSRALFNSLIAPLAEQPADQTNETRAA